MRVALLGVGRMGAELGRHILTAGHQLTVWNRSAEKAKTLVAAGAKEVKTPEEATKDAEIVVTCLFGPDAVDEIALNGNTIQKGQIWLDVTTVGPEDCERYSIWAKAHGIRYVAAPVIGSLGPARAGQLGTYLGGDPKDIEAILPIVRLWSDPKRIVTTEKASAAAVGKLIANMALAISLEGLRECLQFGQTQGLTNEQVIAMLKGTALDWTANFKGPMIRQNDFSDTQFSVDLLAKDIRLMFQAANKEANLPALAAALNSLQETQELGFGDDDIAAMAGNPV